MDAESEYSNHFSPSPLVFPEIEGVNAGSDCFDVLGMLLGIFQKKFVDKINLTSSIHFWCQIPGNTSKSIRKFCKIWLFWELHRQFPGKPEVLQQNGYDLRNQHPSISQKRLFWSLHFTKNLKIETCEIKTKLRYIKIKTKQRTVYPWTPT